MRRLTWVYAVVTGAVTALVVFMGMALFAGNLWVLMHESPYWLLVSVPVSVGVVVGVLIWIERL